MTPLTSPSEINMIDRIADLADQILVAADRDADDRSPTSRPLLWPGSKVVVTGCRDRRRLRAGRDRNLVHVDIGVGNPPLSATRMTASAFCPPFAVMVVLSADRARCPPCPSCLPSRRYRQWRSSRSPMTPFFDLETVEGRRIASTAAGRCFFVSPSHQTGCGQGCRLSHPPAMPCYGPVSPLAHQSILYRCFGLSWS